ncbi:MAG: RNA polymerase factor sigma-54 [Rickettsiaceae bacterium]|nr:RNA polymerase factor sigma-54 [Rickettsiaceae bacterium]
MAKQELGISLKTSLKLTNSITQSLKALQLPTSELEEFVESHLQENPFLVREEKKEESFSLAEFRSSLYFIKPQQKNNFNDYDLIDLLENPISLKEHLNNQIAHVFRDNKQKIIAQFITDYLNDDGFLESSVQEIAKNLKISDEEIENILQKLFQLEPTGVYARSLYECLRIQLQEKGLYNKIYEVLLQNLNLLASNELNKLAKIASCSAEQITSSISEIKKLDPKPGRNFATSKTQIKIPDVYIMLNEDGEIVVFASNENIPEIKVDENFYEQIKSKIIKKEDKTYTNSMFNDALALVKALEMRGKTITLVASAIAKEQEEFFKRGILYLRPLTLSRIAQITGYNESTISRATSNKYAGTPYGVLEMKYFFSSGLKSKYSDEEISSHKVKELIRGLIADEVSAEPLSDDLIAKMLAKFNIILARRTVAKYRESLNIPSSQERRVRAKNS